MRFGPTWLVPVLIAAMLGSSVAANQKPRPLCQAVSKKAKAPIVVILSAFPAEIVPVIAATHVEETIHVGDRDFYRGRMEGVHVVIGLMGIGLVNAENTIVSLLDALHPAGVIVSGVAGSNQRIGDVVITDDWVQARVSGVFPVNAAMMALARRAAPSVPPLETCATVPPGSASGATVCMPFQTELVLGGHGHSDDPYNGAAPCSPNGGDVLGCGLPPVAALVSGADAVVPDIEDMETAAVARRTLERNVPFLGVRAVSDGAGDPKGDRGNFQQFFDYYVLAARNAATVTRTVVAELADVAHDKKQRATCRLLGKGRWTKAAARLGP